MQVETENLFTITNFGLQKGIVRQHIYRMLEAGKLNGVEIDGVMFIIKDELSDNLERQRKPKTKSA